MRKRYPRLRAEDEPALKDEDRHELYRLHEDKQGEYAKLDPWFRWKFEQHLHHDVAKVRAIAARPLYSAFLDRLGLLWIRDTKFFGRLNSFIQYLL